jgi:hypothetical protein
MPELTKEILNLIWGRTRTWQSALSGSAAMDTEDTTSERRLLKRTTRNRQRRTRDGFDERRFRPPLKFFGDGDLKGILSDYAPERSCHAGRTAQGPDAMRPCFAALIAGWKAWLTFR